MELAFAGHTNRWRQPLNWVVFVLYAALLAVSIRHHELWGDEIHSWNISKASPTFSALLTNIRYEGHPPFWYTLMWTLSHVTHDPAYLQGLQYGLACLFTGIFVFYAPFKKPLKCLIPFGYYFLFEYGTLSRNYAGALVFAFLICICLQQKNKRFFLSYYVLLFLLSNTHLLGAVLAASMHLYFVLQLKDGGVKKSRLFLNLLLGAALILPSLYFIFPPSDSEMNMQFWIDRWNRQHITDMFEAPVKSFIPIPAWWQYHFWNTEVLISLKSKSGAFTLPVYGLSVAIVVTLSMLLRKHRNALVLFLTNMLLTFMVAAIFPLNSERYVGFLFIAFLVALWQYVAVKGLLSWQRNVVVVLLVFQMAGAAVAVSRDFRLPFSNASKVHEMIAEVPEEHSIVTDYWCLNNLAAYTGKAFYCIELNRELSYILWDQKMAVAMKAATPYCNGFRKYFAETGKTSVYLLSSNDPAKLLQMEPQFSKQYDVRLLDDRKDAIEQYSNLYLYTVSIRP